MKTSHFNLGYMIGEYLVWQYLPTLNIHGVQSCHVSDVVLDELCEYNRLQSIWYNSDHNSAERDIQWERLKIYEKYLETKYLPEMVECQLPIILLYNQDVADGLDQSLWDSDCCLYDVFEVGGSMIKLKLRN